MTDLIVYKKLDPAKVFTDGGLDAIIHEIKAKVAEHTPDLETATGRKAIASLARKVSSSKVYVDNLGKELVKDWKAKAKKVDLSRRHWRDEMDTLKQATRAPLTAWEDAEKERIAAKAMALEIEVAHDEALEMEALFERERVVNRKYAELAEIEARRNAKEEAERLEKERQEREERIHKDAEEQARRNAENELAQAKAAAEKAERDKLAAFEREQEEKKQAEKRAIEAREQAEREKQEAIEKAKREEREAAELKERERLAKEAEEKAKAERLARHKAHRAKVEREIAQDLTIVGMAMPDDEFDKFIQHVNNGEIRHVTIKY